MDSELPGGEDFRDVTQLFASATGEMAIDAMIMAQGFTLNEAMSAIEIGDPRMDSGAAFDAEGARRPFDLLTPLLPEEVCWILDEALACEMQWHQGNTLMQTVHTCLYMHHLSSISPDLINKGSLAYAYTAERPLQLITHVLRAGILGMVKCVDYAYRELVKGNVHDCEDWQGDKADISLCESVQPKRAIESIELAEMWLMSDGAASLRFRDAMVYRLRLRKILFTIYTLDLPGHAASLPALVEQARNIIKNINSTPIPPPRPPSILYNTSAAETGTPAYSNVRASFDKHMLRKLPSYMPLRALTPPIHKEAWTALEGMLDGWDELAKMAKCECLLSWVAVSELRATVPKWPHRRFPYLRSAAQTVFSNGSTVLERHPYIWLVDRFFLELTCTPLRDYSLVFAASSNADWAVNIFQATVALPVYSWEDFQKDLAKLLMQHVWAAYHNRPRERRHLMRSNAEWHCLYDSAMSLIARVRTTASHTTVANSTILQFIPLVLLYWRANVIRTIVLSGIELELYSEDELPFMYWYLWKLADKQVRILTEIRRLVDIENAASPTSTYISSQIALTSTILYMSKGFFHILCRRSRFDDIRRCTNYAVRFKWMYGKEVDAAECEDMFIPDYRLFLHEESAVLRVERDGRVQKSVECFAQACELLKDAISKVNSDPFISIVGDDYSEHFLGGMLSVSNAMRGVLAQDAFLNLIWESESGGMVWIRDWSPWFPRLEKLKS